MGSSASSTGSVTPKAKRVLSNKELEEKRANNLCFYCDGRYFPGHKCASQVYGLEVVDTEEDIRGQQELEEEEVQPHDDTEEVQPLISLQALQGLSSFQTMKVTGFVGSQPIHILIDSGSTHNFLDSATAKRLRCELLKIPPIRVAVADRAKLNCQAMCRGFCFMILNSTYVTDVHIVPLESCDMLLGVQWLPWDLYSRI